MFTGQFLIRNTTPGDGRPVIVEGSSIQMLELILTRIFSVKRYYHYAFMVVIPLLNGLGGPEAMLFVSSLAAVACCVFLYPDNPFWLTTIRDYSCWSGAVPFLPTGIKAVCIVRPRSTPCRSRRFHSPPILPLLLVLACVFVPPF